MTISRLPHPALGAVLASVIVLNPTPVAHAQGPACDRACLRTTLDAYLNAVIKHDPAAAPLMIGFRQTENAVVVRPGNGLWKTMTGLGSMQRRYLDPVTGQAAYFGIIQEGSAEAVVTVRAKVDDRKISEAEWLLARAGEYGPSGPNGNVFNAKSLAANPPPERTVPKAQRLSRASLLGITNSYFDGLTAHDGTLIIAHPGCVRLENGFSTTQRPVPGGPEGTMSDCTSKGAMANIYAVTARRYPIVDEEAGVVLGLGVFERKPGVAMRRNMFSEWFLIEQGKIRSIYSSMFYPEQDAMVPNWPPFDGNWPVAPAAK